MAGTGNANKSVLQQLNNDEDLRKFSITLADDFRKISDDLEIVEALLHGKLKNMKMVDGSKPNARARNVVAHVKSTRLCVWAARKYTLGIYKSFLKNFAAEIDAAKKPQNKKSNEALVITP